MKGDFNYYESIGPKLGSGRYWCNKCQKGSDTNEEGYCVDCKTKGRDVVLFMAKEEKPEVVEEVKTPEIDKTVEVIKKSRKKKA